MKPADRLANNLLAKVLGEVESILPDEQPPAQTGPVAGPASPAGHDGGQRVDGQGGVAVATAPAPVAAEAPTQHQPEAVHPENYGYIAPQPQWRANVPDIRNQMGNDASNLGGQPPHDNNANQQGPPDQNTQPSPDQPQPGSGLVAVTVEGMLPGAGEFAVYVVRDAVTAQVFGYGVASADAGDLTAHGLRVQTRIARVLPDERGQPVVTVLGSTGDRGAAEATVSALSQHWPGMADEVGPGVAVRAAMAGRVYPVDWALGPDNPASGALGLVDGHLLAQAFAGAPPVPHVTVADLRFDPANRAVSLGPLQVELNETRWAMLLDLSGHVNEVRTPADLAGASGLTDVARVDTNIQYLQAMLDGLGIDSDSLIRPAPGGWLFVDVTEQAPHTVDAVLVDDISRATADHAEASTGLPDASVVEHADQAGSQPPTPSDTPEEAPSQPSGESKERKLLGEIVVMRDHVLAALDTIGQAATGDPIRTRQVADARDMLGDLALASEYLVFETEQADVPHPYVFVAVLEEIHTLIGAAVGETNAGPMLQLLADVAEMEEVSDVLLQRAKCSPAEGTSVIPCIPSLAIWQVCRSSCRPPRLAWKASSISSP